MGVITYFLLAGYTPFDRDTQQAEMEAIIAGDFKFEPEEYWENVSATAKDFVKTCLTIDPKLRPTAKQALEHKWLASEEPHFVDKDGQPADLLPHVKKASNAKKLCTYQIRFLVYHLLMMEYNAGRKATVSIKAMNRMQQLAGVSPEVATLQEDVKKYQLESEKVRHHCWFGRCRH